MKKKIRNLTKEEIQIICRNHEYCEDCPFNISENEDTYCITDYLDLDKEIEID